MVLSLSKILIGSEVVILRASSIVSPNTRAIPETDSVVKLSHCIILIRSHLKILGRLSQIKTSPVEPRKTNCVAPESEM
jgi:hypothetical protein